MSDSPARVQFRRQIEDLDLLRAEAEVGRRTESDLRQTQRLCLPNSSQSCSREGVRTMSAYPGAGSFPEEAEVRGVPSEVEPAVLLGLEIPEGHA